MPIVSAMMQDIQFSYLEKLGVIADCSPLPWSCRTHHGCKLCIYITYGEVLDYFWQRTGTCLQKNVCRLSALSGTQIMAPHLKARATEPLAAFVRVAVNFAGSFVTVQGRWKQLANVSGACLPASRQELSIWRLLTHWTQAVFLMLFSVWLADVAFLNKQFHTTVRTL